AFEKVEHVVPQWSFDDAFDEDDIRLFDNRIRKNLVAHFGNDVQYEYTVELKIDGLKVVLTYEQGKLVSAATRGDGRVGENVTSNVKTIRSIPLVLRSNATLVSEGEIFMPKSVFDEENIRRQKEG